MQSGRERLRAWIERSKLNQTQAAAMLAIHPVMLSQILNGVRNPGLNTALTIEEVTGVPVRSWALKPVSTDEPDESVTAGKPKITKR